MLFPILMLLQAAPAVGAEDSCRVLARQWRGIEMDLAADYAEGAADNSAPRATLREQRETNALLRAQMLLAMMRDNKCSLPKAPPSYATYALPAVTCRTDRLQSYSVKDVPPSCNRDNWKAAGAGQ